MTHSLEIFLAASQAVRQGIEMVPQSRNDKEYFAHTDVINADHALAESHANEAIHGFGSYGDGFIRNRKMYVFPHLFSIDSDAIGRCRLVVPTEWRVRHDSLTRVDTIARTVAAERISGYSIDLRRQGQAEVKIARESGAGTTRSFDVFETANL